MSEPKWWHGAVLYQVYPRSFFDADQDGVGDLEGILAKVDYLADLGVDGIWLSPVYKSPMRDFGYDVSDYKQIDPLFGDVEILEKLIAALHARNLKILLDIVPSHTSEEHDWFIESRQDRTNPKADWYIWCDPKPDGTPPNNWQSNFGGTGWTWSPVRRQYFYTAYLPEQPALNYHNPAVVEAMMDVMRYWFGKGVDGFRLDAMQSIIQDRDLRDNPPKAKAELARIPERLLGNTSRFQSHLFDADVPEVVPLVQRMREVADEYKDKLLMAEIGGVPDQAAACAWITGDDRLHSAYNFDLTYLDFNYDEVSKIVRHTVGTMQDRWLTWTLGNHDSKRVGSRWTATIAQKDRSDFLLLAFAWLMSMRGLVSLYQGDELGLTETDVPYERMQDPLGKRLYPASKGRDGCRIPLPWQHDSANFGFSKVRPWLPVDDSHRALAIDLQQADKTSLYSRIRRFLAWRNEHAVLREGEMTLLELPAGLLGFDRRLGDMTMRAIFNFSADAVELPGLSGFALFGGAGFEVPTSPTGPTVLPPYRAYYGQKLKNT
jgi:alpha-glucosidase